MAADYYQALHRAILSEPALREVLHRCRYCRIRFLSYLSNPRSARDGELGCPMGCSRRHGKRKSVKRSTGYYQTPEGKQKKKELNRRRSKPGSAKTPVATDPRGRERCLLKYLHFILEQVDRRRVLSIEVERFYDESCEIVRQHGLERWRKPWQSRDG